ncbi:MAG: hypothetical protein R3C14_08370 [Caldilineaceae bacterium]
MNTLPGAAKAKSVGADQATVIALYTFMLMTWLLIALAQMGHFNWWYFILPLLPLIVGVAGWAWLRLPQPDRLATLALVVVGAVVFFPPAEHLPLTGDAAIYANEGAFLARVGALKTIYEPLAVLRPKARDPFFVSSQEQFPRTPVQSYQGIVYGDYYLVDTATVALHTSRMPLTEVWLALLTKLQGIRLAFYSTGLFATLSLLVLYALGRQFFDRGIALWVVLLLALSYPQIHFGRTSYSEIAGQFWTLAGFYYAVRWTKVRKSWLLTTAFLAWVTTWAGRLDAFMLLGTVGMLLLIAATARDGRSLWTTLLFAPVYGGLIWLGANGYYVRATGELLGVALQGFAYLFFGAVIALPMMVWIFWQWGEQLVALLQQLAPQLIVLVWLICAFAILWATLPNPWRNPEQTRPFQEIIWFSSAYVTPLFYWLALAGLALLLWRQRRASTLLLVATVLMLAAIFFARYTSANVYPVSLRRLISTLIPLMAILAGAVMAAPASGTRFWAFWRVARWGVGAIALGWMLFLSWPALQQHEAAGNVAFLEQFHANLPQNGVFFFETQDGDSWVGWLAAPLYSLYNDWALMLDSDTPDPQQLADAVTDWQATGRTVYVVSEHNPLPAPLLPPGYAATLVLEDRWRSSLIGQTRAPYPPPYWEFEHPVYIYELMSTATTVTTATLRSSGGQAIRITPQNSN